MNKEYKTLNDAIIHDKQIETYLTEHSTIQKKIIERKKEIAKDKKLLFDNLEDLATELSLDMEEIEKKENSHVRIYRPLDEEKKHFFYHKKGDSIVISPLGYDCPTCGVVKGAPKQEGYNSLGPLSGSKGVHHKCYICDHILKEDVYVIS